MSQARRIVYPDADPTTVHLLKGRLWSRLEALGTFTCHVGAPADDEAELSVSSGANWKMCEWLESTAISIGGRNILISC